LKGENFALMTKTLPLETRASSYYSQGRGDVIAELTPPLGRVLDVGCGEGGANDNLRARGAGEIVGVEILAEAAARAAERYDHVEVGDAEAALQRLQGPFDTILCYDVLEHLVDPGALLSQLRTLAAPQARLHISVPNARHYSLVADLVLRGTFGYTEWGHRDATHLRWFTRRDMRGVLQDAGWSVASTTSSAQLRLRELGLPALKRVANGLGGEFFGRSWYILAHPAGGST
jgi:2-polyprenyl-3-methyl-5-hydroxy-6-metoxy-1,4-benzoquinol methylase